MNSLRLTTLVLLAGALAAPTALADGRKPGSKLVYPVHRSGLGLFTIVSVTNIDTRPATPVSFGGSTNVHFEYFNATPTLGRPFEPHCTVFDRVEYLTPADTLSVLTTCHNATFGAGQAGYLVVTAQDPAQFGVDWSHNQLIGSSIVINGSGSMYVLNARPIRALFGPGQPIGPQVEGLEACDGVRYEALPDTLMIDSFLAVGSPQLALVSATGQRGDFRDVLFQVWNDNEFPLSTTLRFRCWFDEPLTSVSPLFSDAFLRSTPNDANELDINCDGIGDLEAGWAMITTRSVSRADGSLDAIDLGMLGAITAGPTAAINGGRLLWEGEIEVRQGE